MMNQHKNTDVKNGYRRLIRAGALFTATSAIIAMLGGSVASGQQAPSDGGPATRPSMVSDGVASDGSIRLTSGKSTIVTFRRMYSTISVGMTEIADVNKISPTSVLITAKKPGTTALVVLDDDKRSEVIDIVVDPDLAMLERQLKQAFPGLDVLVSPLNDTIAVRGKVPTTEVAEQIVEMASTYGKVHNFLDICGGQQINLQVRFAEVSKTAMRNLGVTFGGTDGVSTFTTNGIGPGANIFTFPPAAGASPLSSLVSGNLYGSGQFAHVSFDYLITAMRQNNLLRTLAEPNLLTSSGQEASFLAGGQIPIPVPQPGNGGTTITIQYVNYGVQLKFTPNVLGNGKIRLHVAPEVSQLDYSHAVYLAGSTDPVPGFTDRKLETTVELGDGQSLALAGLLQKDVSASSQAIPVLGDLPILGALFRSTAYTRDETELVVIVTPRLAAPLNPDQVPLLPGEHWRYPTEAEQFFHVDLGGPMVEPSKTRADTKSAGAPPQFHGNFGFTAVGAGSVKATTEDSQAPAK